MDIKTRRYLLDKVLDYLNEHPELKDSWEKEVQEAQESKSESRDSSSD
jgi:hypothetical protein